MFQEMMRGLIVDNFAGGGGASEGIEEAFGRPVDYAINHDDEAVAMHKANHPGTIHICQSVWKADPQEIAAGRPVALAWFSPDCKHFSKAKGGRPVEKNIRDLAWVVVHWARRVRPKVLMLENVEEFRQWAPLDEKGRPITDEKRLEQPHLWPEPQLVRKGKRKKLKPNGETFELWVAALRKEGYRIEWRELRGCDFGAPTIRKRLFVIARCDGRPIVWPKPSHRPARARDGIVTKWAEGHGLTLADLQDMPPYRTAAECIDWSIPCPSIFERAENGKRPLAENTKKRIAAGIMRFVVNNPRPFIVPLCHTKGGNRAQDGAEPLRTITTAKGGEFALVAPVIVGVGGRRGCSPPVGVNRPYPTATAKLDAAWVTAQLAPFIVTNNTNNAPQSIDSQGASTVTTGNRLYLLTPILVHTAHGEKTRAGQSRGERRRGRGAISALEGMPTTTAKGTVALACATLIQTGYGERAGQSPRVPGLDKPLGTSVAGGVKHAVISATIVGVGGSQYAGKPRGTDQPAGTVLTHDRRALVTAFLAQHHSESKGNVRAGREAGEPMSTVVHRGTQQGLVIAHLEQANTGMVGHHPLDPLSTIVGKGCTQRVVTSHLLKFKGTCRHGQPMDEPAPTVQAGGWHIAEVQAFLVKYYGAAAHGQLPDGPLHTVTAKPRFGLVTVTIDGEEYVIVDIGMRMLTARELARAQGFPDSYILDPWVERADKRGRVKRYRLPKTSQVRMIGNSVNRQVARALVAANCNEPAAMEERAAA